MESKIDQEKLAWVRAWLAHVRECEGDMSIQRLQILLEVYAQQPETTMQNLIRALDITPSHMTRMLQSWSSRTATKKAGPGYVNIYADPDNLKTRLVEITGRGVKAISRLLSP